MIIAEVTMSYPCIRYKVKASHFTSRKSTAIEWAILEAIDKCDTPDIPISVFFDQIFTISDADLLIRPCLLNLYDIGAITIKNIDNETELSSVPMENLKLTITGKKMQTDGLLPGTPSEDTFTIYYDLYSRTLREEALLFKENATGIKVMQEGEIQDVEFPCPAIAKWLSSIQENRQKIKMRWLTPTTKIEEITSLKADVLWKNSAKKINLSDGMQWQIVGEENTAFHELLLNQTKFVYPDEIKELPKLGIENPDKEMKQFIPISEISTFIRKNQLQDDFFYVNEKYYTESQADRLGKKKNLRVAFVFGADSLNVTSKGKQLTIHVPDQIESNVLYGNRTTALQAGVVTVYAGNAAKDIAIAYVPREEQVNIESQLVPYIDKYYEQENDILFALIEMGLKDSFLDHVSALVTKEESIADKAKIISMLNSRSVSFYNKKLILSPVKEKLLIDEEKIKQRSKSIESAAAVLHEFFDVPLLRQDESMIKNIIQVVVEALGKLNNLNDIWNFWSAVEEISKSYMVWINDSGLYRMLYSDTCITDLVKRLFDQELPELKEYTEVERTALNMMQIYHEIQKLLPEFDMYSTASNERYNEFIINHRGIINSLYEQIRQWQEEEDKLGEILAIDCFNSPESTFAKVKTAIDGLRKAVAHFFDDSFMKYNKVYIIDTCTLMREPELISWFDGTNVLLVIPMVVLNELDGKKSSKDENEAFCAREAIRNINKYNVCEWVCTGVQSCPELLSNDLDKNHNDNKILSIALRYCAKDPIILTDDINFRNIADAHKIKNMSIDSYKNDSKKFIHRSNKKKHEVVQH